MTRLAWLALLLCAMLIFTGLGAGRVDPSSKKIRILYLGDDRATSQIALTMGWIRAEPKFDLTIVPADLYHIQFAEAWRYTRLYLPRTFGQLNSSCDVIVLNNISPFVMESKVLDNFQQGIVEEGLGIALVTFFFWGGSGTNDIEVWTKLPFYDVFPADVGMTRQYWGYEGKIYIEVVRRKPIMDLPGIEEVPFEHTLNHGADIFPRPGSVVHTIWRGHRSPVHVSGQYGEGMTLQLSTAWHIVPKEVMASYPYMPDYIYNQLYFVARASPPEDIFLAHRTREMFIDVRTRRIITLSAIEFADKFGAKVGRIEEKLAQLDEEVRSAVLSYLDGDYDFAASKLQSVMKAYPDIEAEVAKVKNDSLLWIYLTEWLVVASTSILCGITLWTLMVRRKMYTEVSTTQLFRSL